MTIMSFERLWVTLLTCRRTKNYIRINEKNFKYLINVSRARLKKFVGVVTGHLGFNRHLTIIGKQMDPSCELCGSMKTTVWISH